MGKVVNFPADRAKQIAFDNPELAKTNFRREFASLCIASEYNDIPREWLVAHLETVVNRLRESLEPHNRDLEKKAYGD